MIIAIIIVNYNGNDDTFDCLHSIEKYLLSSKSHQYEIYLVDNGSESPIMEEKLLGFKMNIHYLRSIQNLGFTGGNNYALKLINNGNEKYNYILLLNNDTVLVDDSIDRLVDVIKNDEADICGLVNYYYDCPKQIWQAGSFVRPNRLYGKQIRDFDTTSDNVIYVDAIPGSSILIKNDIVMKIGLFDERFFAYYEEMDFCIRAKENGYRVAFLPNTKILHKVGRSSTSMLKHYLRTRNTFLFYSLHYKQYMILAYFRALLRTIKCIVKSKDLKYISPFVKGIADYRHGFFHEGSMMNFK